MRARLHSDFVAPRAGRVVVCSLRSHQDIEPVTRSEEHPSWGAPGVLVSDGVGYELLRPRSVDRL
jgi:hypothetical protein